MCGICGYTGDEIPGLLSRMIGVLAHRGPDDEGRFEAPGVHLGVRRLAVIDPAGGAQPIRDESDRRVVVANGEIYNHRELRRSLLEAGHRFRSRADTEVLVHLHEDLGDGLCSRLDGMFAFALWDGSRRALLLARDRMGEKPLYHASTGGRLFFASEIKALLVVPQLRRSLDPDALDEFLAWQYPTGTRTLLAGIESLEPAHAMTVTPEGTAVRRYWSLPSPDTRNVAPVEIASRLDEAVRSRMVSDVPIGCFLSGGVDSSAVAVFMAHASPGPIRTFTVGFERSGGADERPQAREVARRLGAIHREVELPPPSGRDLIELTRMLDQPCANPAAVATSRLARLARETVTVVLTGEGADETFCGYGKYLYPRLAAWAPPVARSLAGALAGRVPARGAWRPLHRLLAAASGAGPDGAFAAVNAVFDRHDRARLVPGANPARDEDLVARVVGPARFEPHRRASRFDLAGYLPQDNLVRVDRTTMAHGLEARSPFLAPALVETALATRLAVPLSPPRTKRPLREALAAVLPPEVVRREKRAFEPPVDAWLRGPLARFVDAALGADHLRGQGLFAPGAVAALVKAHRAGQAHLARGVWTLAAFQLWHALVLEDPAEASPVLERLDEVGALEVEP